MGNKISLEDQLVNLRTHQNKCKGQQKNAKQIKKTQKDKVKKAVQQGNHDGARIFAQNAIREKQQALNYLRLSSRLEGVSARLETAIRMNQVSSTMSGIVKGMDKALKSMDVETISKTMDAFEKQFEDMDVRTVYMEGAMESTTATTTPQEAVDELIQEVADEHGLKLGEQFDEMGTVSNKVPTQPNEVKQNDLEARFANLNK